MLIGLVQPLLDGSEHNSVLVIHNLRDCGTFGAKFLNLVLCSWGEDIQRLTSFRVYLTLWKKCVCMKMCLFWLVCVKFVSGTYVCENAKMYLECHQTS